MRPEITTEEYFNLANELIQVDPVINTMALAPDGIINAVYPVEGHQAAIGLDLFKHPERKDIVQKTVETGKTFVAGPVELVEGGIAFISYTPIFDKTVDPPYPFWGITDVIIKKDELIKATSISETSQNARFAIRGYDGLGHEGAVFFGAPEIFDLDPVTMPVSLPDGEWILAAIPQNGWSGYLDQDRILIIIFLTSGIVISILLGLFASAINWIRSDAQKMKSIFRAMSSMVLEVDAKLNIVWSAPSKEGTNLMKPADSLLAGKKLSYILPKIGDLELELIRDSLEHKKVSSFETKLAHHSDAKWMLVTLSPYRDDHLIVLVNDISHIKEQETKLSHSESELRRLNTNKDRLFSIIAHDLRTPLTAITGLSDQLLNHRDELEPEEQEEFIEMIYQSGQENLLLLENLLTWAKAQQEGMISTPEVISLHKATLQVSNAFRELAVLKGIQMKNLIEDECFVHFDPSMLQTVIRNLLSNAIKFSKSGQTIEIGLTTCEKSTSERAKAEVYVRDHGVGMSQETIDLILKSGGAASSIGTAEELGSGLGLPLCVDFLRQHEQTLRIESQPNQGCTIYFSIRLA